VVSNEHALIALYVTADLSSSGVEVGLLGLLEALNEELHKRSTLPQSVVTMIDSLPKEPAAVAISFQAMDMF
jgi:hypothetical protein